jgi:hypothetical protein
MIRNYYTDSFKNAVVPVISNTQLIDGRTKVVTTFTANNNLVIASSTDKITFPVSHTQIKIGMFVDGTDGNGVVIPSGTRVIGVSADSKIITISSVISAFQVNQNITFTLQIQGSWKEYNLYIGKSPVSYLPGSGGVVTTAISNAAANGQAILTWKQPNSLVAVDMLVYDDGVLVGIVSAVDSTTQVTLTQNLTGAIADLSKLTFTYANTSSITVTTIEGETISISNPAQGFVLPLSVVQVNSTTGGIGNLVAFN